MHYADYHWKKGRPVGIKKVPVSHSLSYKLISDPYYKWISIEIYKKGLFDRVVYDSKFFDFRHLKPENQIAWQKEILEETPSSTRCLIRNQDDRAILTEHYLFEEKRCRECKSYSSQGTLVSIQELFYTDLGDSFNGVILFDANRHPITKKIYAWDAENEAFSDLIKEEWEMCTPIPT